MPSNWLWGANWPRVGASPYSRALAALPRQSEGRVARFLVWATSAISGRGCCRLRRTSAAAAVTRAAARIPAAVSAQQRGSAVLDFRQSVVWQSDAIRFLWRSPDFTSSANHRLSGLDGHVPSRHVTLSAFLLHVIALKKRHVSLISQTNVRPATPASARRKFDGRVASCWCMMLQ